MNRFSQHRSIRCRVALLAILPIFLVSATTQLRGETIRRDLVETAVAAGNFETLIAAASAAGLADVLAGDGPFTLFAPTDEAFEKLPPGTVESLLEPENKSKLVRVLKYHVLSGPVYAEQAAAAEQANTLLGRTVETTVTADGLRINDALVTRPDLETANGVIHVIDSVLLPKPMDRHQAMRTLESAIHRGVPVYNHGDHRSCAEIYTAACRAIVNSESHGMPPQMLTGLQATLDYAEHMNHAGARAGRYVTVLIRHW